jgi:hypothetical protein
MTPEEHNQRKVIIHRFKKELRRVLREHGMDKASGIPDQLLAEFLFNQIISLGRLIDSSEDYRNM